MRWPVIGVRRKLAVLTSVVVLGVLGGTILLKLPQRIRRGEQGQQAIAMLDAVRRPFLEINRARARLLDPAEAEASYSALSTVVVSARELLERYQGLARYNDALSSNVAELSESFETWVAAERRLFRLPEVTAGVRGAGPATLGFRADLASATSGFSHTMDLLGAGEVPLHADIADGGSATRLLGILGFLLLVHLTVTAFLLLQAIRRRERRFLEERLRLEQEARELERDLAATLAKVLSGFIPICAGCKRIRGEDDQWTQVERYVTTRTDAQFSHSICPGCEQRLYEDVLFPPAGPGSP